MFLQPFQHLQKIRIKAGAEEKPPFCSLLKGLLQDQVSPGSSTLYHHYHRASSASTNHEVRVSQFTTNPTNRFSSSIKLRLSMKLWHLRTRVPCISNLPESIFISRRLPHQAGMQRRGMPKHVLDFCLKAPNNTLLNSVTYFSLSLLLSFSYS